MIVETKRQAKSRENKQKIVDAVKDLMSDYGYSALTVKNVCETAGVSNGSFFHYFGSKEDLLAYYLNEGFRAYLDEQGVEMDAAPDFSEQPLERQIVDLYLHYADYCMASGIEFISDFYSTSNPALAVHLPRFGQPGDIVSIRIVDFVRAAQEQGIVPAALDAEVVERDLCIMVKGSIFEWCLSHGETDLRDNIQRLLSIYMQSQFA